MTESQRDPSQRRAEPELPAGFEEVVESRLAICATCPQANGLRCSLLDMGCSRTYREVLYSLRALCPMKKWPRLQDGRTVFPRAELVIDCSTHGFGDCMTAAWLSEGAKQVPRRIFLHATAEQAKLLRMLGQDVVGWEEDMLSLHHTDQQALSDPLCGRLDAWRTCLGLSEIEPARPPCLISARSLESMARYMEAPYVVLCPQSVHANREWPAVYWLELAERLRGRSLTVWIVCREGREFSADSGCLSDLNWQRIAALFSHAVMVVGNDSAPIHLAGLLERPALALLGPTNPSSFAHLPSVRGLAAEQSSIPCGGCWFLPPKYQHDPCGTGCAALSCLRVSAVEDAILGGGN